MPGLAIIHKCCYPVYAEMLRPRVVALTIAAAGAAQIVGSMFGVGMPCAFHRMTGCPCPGCGLTRSIMALLHGQVRESVLLHPFGPLLLGALALALAAAILPVKMRGWLIRWIGKIEEKTGFVVLAMVLLMLLWCVRLTGVLPLRAV